MLVNNCRIYNEDNWACSTHYKSHSERKGKNLFHGKFYSAPADIRKHRASNERKLSGGETLASFKCFKCGELGHRDDEHKNNVLRCFK